MEDQAQDYVFVLKGEPYDGLVIGGQAAEFLVNLFNGEAGMRHSGVSNPGPSPRYLVTLNGGVQERALEAWDALGIKEDLPYIYQIVDTRPGNIVAIKCRADAPAK